MRNSSSYMSAQNDKSFDALILLKYLYRFTFILLTYANVCVHVSARGLVHFVWHFKSEFYNTANEADLNASRSLLLPLLRHSQLLPPSLSHITIAFACI